MNALYNLPDELIEYIFCMIHKDHYSLVLKELQERTILRNNERINEIVENYVDQLIHDVLANIPHQL